MDSNLKDKLYDAIDKALDEAEKIWMEVEFQFLNEDLVKAIRSFSEVSVPSQIPGFPKVTKGKPEIADFIALVLDIRGSTNHLLQRITQGGAKASQLERVLYETTAISTAGYLIIDHHHGGLTEYLGDGFLALFKVNDTKNPIEVYDAHRAANDCLNDGLDIINQKLNKRYLLPPLKIGIGLAFSQAIVTIVGYGDNLHPKALGECVFRASRLSKGYNEILVDEKLKLLWPSTKGGILSFILHLSDKNFNGYRIQYKK
jgi:hypothetical protein